MAFVQNTLRYLAETFELNAVAAGLIALLLLYRAWLLARSPEPQRASARARAIAAGIPEGSTETFESVDAGLWLILVLYLLVRPYVATVVEVTSPTMQPTLQGSPTPQIDGPNDRVMISRYLYRLRAPQRGEVVAWRPDDARPGALELGRLLAMPGDRIRIDASGRMHVNDAFVAAAGSAEKQQGAPAIAVPEDCLLVMGDAPRDGADGRRWSIDGYLRVDQLQGKATAVVWPLDRVRLLD